MFDDLLNPCSAMWIGHDQKRNARNDPAKQTPIPDGTPPGGLLWKMIGSVITVTLTVSFLTLGTFLISALRAKYLAR